MESFEYLLILASVVLGLAVTDLATSLHRLLAAGGRVKWDWLAPLAAMVAFLKIVTQWWSWRAAASMAGGFTFEMFLGVLVATVLLFLMAAAALPDEAGEVDLAAHYEAVRRRFWTLFVGHWLLMNGVSVWAQMQIAHARLSPLSLVLLLGPLALTMVFVRNRWVHTAVLAGLCVVYVGQFLGRGLPS
ncbi:hypothetical protein [Phenylobacterium sp.]|uniref:hypothetical protein n=1 Tax=Phenylobacterium sp. TaxID=1871053 RepID=UPI002CC7C423|nr:hypothetical protein [Phenylobacterium sp.]HVI31864.1 hypothetical protein [Phenylobacterium sp.]